VTGLLDGVRAVVTGASRGIGRASAAAMAREGATVVTLARTSQEWIASDRSSSRLHPIEVDVSDADAVVVACQQARELLGGIDVLVNNAGVPGPEAPDWTCDPRHAATSLAINTLGPFHLMRAVLPAMVKDGRGVVLNVSSGGAVRPKAGKAWYGASKAALDHLVAAAALELAGTGVRIHAIYPGPVDTALNFANRHGGSQEDKARLRPPAEVGALVAWLASENGAVVEELIVEWREGRTQERLRAMPGFPEPIR
jgi:NAD(P)-dependent dehydrogenase (short-subunit alcohol dehydrogenase family)